MLKKQFLPFFILLLNLNAIAQNSTLTGKVSSAQTGESLPGVSILVDGKAMATTDENGQYILSLDSGIHEINFRYISFQDRNTLVILKAGETRIVNIRMITSASN